MKKFFKRLMFISLPVIFVLAGSICLVAGEVAPDGVILAAQQGLANFTKACDTGNNPGLKVVKNSSLGFGFQVYSVKPEVLLNATELRNQSLPTGTWRFVVKNADSSTLITVAKVADGWQAVSIGGAGLASEVERVMVRWPAEDGYEARFLRIYQAKSDFIEITRHGKLVGYVPLAASIHSLKLNDSFDPGCIKHTAEVLPLLQDAVLREMARKNVEK